MPECCRILLNFDQMFSGFFKNAAKFPKPSEAFWRYQRGTQGSVPVPPDAAFGHYTPFLAHAAPLGRANGRCPRPFERSTPLTFLVGSDSPSADIFASSPYCDPRSPGPFSKTSRRAAVYGRAELLANPAIRVQILAGSIQTPHGLTNL